MQNKCVQLELSCEDVMSAMEENDYKLITLLEKYLDFDALIPVSFIVHTICTKDVSESML